MNCRELYLHLMNRQYVFMGPYKPMHLRNLMVENMEY